MTGTAPSLTYTPGADFSGADSFRFRVSDGVETSTPATVSITVISGNRAPTANTQSVTTNEDTAIAITLRGTDPDGDALAFAVISGPTRGTLTGTAPNLTYRPRTGFSGADSFRFTVSDGVDTSAPATVSITVRPVDDALFCGKAAFDKNTERATFLWKDCNADDEWHLRVTGGTPAVSIDYRARIDAPGGLLFPLPVSIESTDSLDNADADPHRLSGPPRRSRRTAFTGACQYREQRCAQCFDPGRAQLCDEDHHESHRRHQLRAAAGRVLHAAGARPAGASRRRRVVLSTTTLDFATGRLCAP